MKVFLSFLSLFLLISTPFIPIQAQQLRGVVISDHLSADDIAVLQSWKVKLVRYNLLWDDVSASDNSTPETYRAWLQNEFTKLDPILTALEAAGIKMALNLFTPPGGFSSRSSKASHRVFEQQWAQDEFVLAWQTIAERYKGRTGIFGFDLLNEPAQVSRPAAPLKDWNQLAQTAADAVRAIDPTTPIIMTPAYGKITRLKQMKRLTTSNVYYTIHYYYPWRFIHQGVYGVKMGIKYPTKTDNIEKLKKDLKPLYQFSKKYKAPVYIGEFSVARWAPSGSGAKYLRDLVSTFTKYKFSWTYHTFRGAGIWDLELSDKRADLARTTTPSGRLKALLKGFAKNP